MPFKSQAQRKACFATNGFNGKVDCHEWAHATHNMKSLPKKVKKNYGGMMDYRRKKCMSCGGKMQAGGFPREQDFPDHESYMEAVDQFVAAGQQPTPRINIPQQAGISQNDFFPEKAAPLTSSTPNLGVLEPKAVDDIDAQANQLYASGSKSYQQGYDKDLGMSVLDNGTGFERRNYRNFYRGKYGEGIKPVDPFQVGLGLKGVEAGLSWLSGVIDRRRQNRYKQNQYSTLGQNDAIPASNFQPNPYNLYAKLGGNLKRYMFTNKAENKNFPVDAGKMQQGGNISQGRRNWVNKMRQEEAAKIPIGPATDYGQSLDGRFPIGAATNYGTVDPLHPQFSVPMTKRMKFKNVNFFGAPQPPLFDPMNSLTSMIGTQNEDFMSVLQRMRPEFKRGGNWIQSAVNPEHKGYCTPLSKSTCTGHRRALALTFKKHHGFHKKKK